MSRDNVKRVLVTSGNKPALAAGGKIDALALGQIGVFDAATNLAIDASSTPKDFYLAVGIDGNGEGAMNDIKESAGQYIQSANLRSYTFRPHTASRPMIKTVTGIDAPEVGKDYAIKVEIRNEKIYRNTGHNQFSFTYSVVADTTVAADLAQKFVDSINANDDNTFVSATLSGANIVLTSKSLAANPSANVNIKYYNSRESVIIVSLTEGFASGATVEDTQDVVFEEGSGTQIRQLEYHETGLASPYVVSDVTAIARTLPYTAVAGTKYDQFNLEYDFFSVGGWLEYLNNLQTTIAVPEPDTATRDSLVDILDAQYENKGFDGKSEVAKSSSTDPDVVEPSNDDDTQGPPIV